ncbi:MAG TPA: hypothetical protein VJ895_02860 [Candidatus Nanoarchaeia archaeon]|nr:hypothetical protein [Candidatus Nanoarchaeia archaeon]
MDKDKKINKPEGFCEECGHRLCSNCGKCCYCGECDCIKCHTKEKSGELEEEIPVNYS